MEDNDQGSAPNTLEDEPAGRTPVAALRHRDFSIYWAGSVLSQVGSQFTTVAMAWQIYELTNSPLELGLLGLARGAPMLGLLLFGGLLADAVNRRHLMMATQIGQMCVSAGLAVMTLAGKVSPPVLYAASLFLALFSSLEQPARSAIIPNLVPRSDLTNALALTGTQRYAATTSVHRSPASCSPTVDQRFATRSTRYHGWQCSPRFSSCVPSLKSPAGAGLSPCRLYARGWSSSVEDQRLCHLI